MAKFFGTQGKPVSASGGLSVPSTAVPPAPQAAAVPQASSQSDKRDLESSRQPPAAADSSAGTLVIGPQIVLSGEVTSCNRLVVEGTIKANIKECRDIAIAQGGLFSGSAAVQSADISGRFEGELTVSGRLLIRAPGLVSGTVQYRELEIERGGRIAGNVSAASGSGNGGKA
jgi:cytoskeletal protein CcmA (bactofilin family)